MRNWIIYAVTLLTLQSCYDRIEKCLDEYAANYDVSADDACFDCCTFPALTLKLEHKLGDSTYSNRDTLINDLGQLYVIEDVRYYLSNVHIYQDGQPLGIRQHIATEDNLLIISDDMKIIKSSDKEVTFGTVKAFGTFDSLGCNFGMSELMTENTFVNLTTDHVLQPLVKLKNKENKQAYLTMKYKRITPVADTVSQIIAVTQRPDFPAIVLKKTIKTIIGNPMIYTIKADYKVLLQDQNLSLSADTLSSLIFGNLSKMIKDE